MKYKCVIFDCDGTLLDTLGDIASAMNKALSFHGYPAVPLEKYRDMTGWGIYRLAELALPEEARTKDNISLLGASAERYMAVKPEDSLTKPYPGMKALLSKLSDLDFPHGKKFSLAVLSNKPDLALRQIIAGFFPEISFDAVYGMRPGFAAKPEPSMTWELLNEINCLPHETIFAGDSEIDIETARNSGCYPLGVSWGFRSRAALQSAGAARIIDRPEELLEMII